MQKKKKKPPTVAQMYAKIHRELRAIHKLLHKTLHLEKRIMATVDEVVTAVQDESTVEQSAIVLLTQLHDMVANAGTDPTKLQGVLDSLSANKEALAAAVVANTPVAPSGAERHPRKHK